MFNKFGSREQLDNKLLTEIEIPKIYISILNILQLRLSRIVFNCHFNLSEFSSRFESHWSVSSESVVGLSSYADEIATESSKPKFALSQHSLKIKTRRQLNLVFQFEYSIPIYLDCNDCHLKPDPLRTVFDHSQNPPRMQIDSTLAIAMRFLMFADTTQSSMIPNIHS